MRIPAIGLALALCAAAPVGAQPSHAGRAMLLPLQDRTGSAEVSRLVVQALEVEFGKTLRLLPADGLRDELRRLRLRDSADIDPADLRRLAEAFEIDWWISVTLHAAWQEPEPQIVLSAWAHRVDDDTLAWAGFESAAGPDCERAFGRGRIELLETLAARSVRLLAADFADGLAGERAAPAAAPDRGGFLLATLGVEDLGTIAVLPFEAVTDYRKAESAELITALARATLYRNGASVAHPGRVGAILRRRGVYQRGELDPLARSALGIAAGADHILTGTVETYEAPAAEEPNPHVAFSARLIAVDDGRIVWIHGKEGKGWDRPGFFARKRVYDAGGLAEKMMQSLVAGFLRHERR